LNPNIPTSLPPSSISAAFFACAIRSPASFTDVLNDTIVVGILDNKLRNVGDAAFPNDWDIILPSIWDKYSDWESPNPWNDDNCLTASSVLFLFFFSSINSNFSIASFKHFAISNKPTTSHFLLTTGKWRKWLSIIMANASMAKSSIETILGLMVITFDTKVNDGFRFFATTLRVISISVNIPTRLPRESTIRAASLRLFESIWQTDKTFSWQEDRIGFLGLNFLIECLLLFMSIFFR